MASTVPVVAVRGSTGISLSLGPPSYELVSAFPRDDSKSCKCMLFSPKGDYFVWANGEKVTVVSTSEWKILTELPNPKVARVHFSPIGTYFSTWENAVAKEGSEPAPNVHIYETATGKEIMSFVQKSCTEWEPVWSIDEALVSKCVNRDVLFYDPKDTSKVANRVANQRVFQYSIAPSPAPYFILCYSPGKQGQPSPCKLYQYPKFDTPVVSKMFMQAEKVDMRWNNKGTHVLIITSIEVDESSYYGKKALHFVSTKGESSIFPLGKDGGPLQSVEWSPNSIEFCIIYGYMPAKATIYNLKCDPVFELGVGPRNSIYFNPHGNILLLGGFGNLPGNVELWDVPQRKLICKTTAPLTTFLSWSPDGQHFMTATTAPRLRTCNGYHVWHYSGTLLYERPWNKQEELWEVLWQNMPEGTFKTPQINYKPVEGIAPSQPQASKEAYRPPTARGRTIRFSLHDNEGTTTDAANPSKAALKQRKKREAKKAAKAAAAAEGQGEETENSSKQNGMKGFLDEYTTDDPAKLKKLGRLKAKLKEIERLKEQQKAGKQLEKNQLEKISKEEVLMEEMKELSL